MTARENILLCLEQCAAVSRLPFYRERGKFDSVDDDCIANLLAEVKWSKMSPSAVREVIEFVLARCDVRSVARMSGAANAERETLRGVLADMASDGHEVIDVDAEKQANATNTAVRKVA